jgi:hypothetical protein
MDQLLVRSAFGEVTAAVSLTGLISARNDISLAEARANAALQPGSQRA